MKKTVKPSALEGKYRIVSARIDLGFNGNPIVLTLYSKSSGYATLVFEYHLLKIAPMISKQITEPTSKEGLSPLCDNVLEIASDTQFRVPLVREPEKNELIEINDTPPENKPAKKKS